MISDSREFKSKHTKQWLLMWISHNVPVKSPQANCGIRRFSVLTFAYPSCHENSTTSLLCIPDLPWWTGSGRGGMCEEYCSSAEMSDGGSPIPFPSSFWPLDCDIVTFQPFSDRTCFHSRLKNDLEVRRGGVSGFRHEGGKVLRRKIVDQGFWIEAFEVQIRRYTMDLASGGAVV